MLVQFNICTLKVGSDGSSFLFALSYIGSFKGTQIFDHALDLAVSLHTSFSLFLATQLQNISNFEAEPPMDYCVTVIENK
jgi:hypothetical protein